MSQVYFTFANKDKDAVLPIIEAVRQAGFSVWHPGMISLSESHLARVNDEIKAAKCVVAFWSAAAAASEFVQAAMQHVLRAWSSNRLVLVVLDEAELPLGLRDLPVIALKGPPETGEKKLVERVRSIIDSKENLASPNYAAKAKRLSVPRWAIAGVTVVVLLGLFAYAHWFDSLQSRVLYHHSWPLPTSSSTGGAASSWSLSEILIALGVGIAIGALLVWGWFVLSRRRLKLVSPLSIPTPMERSSPPQDGAPQVFVSYSRQDGSTVDQIVQQISQLGYVVWIDRQSTGSQRYAGPIVQAIRSSQLVALMCSAQAFKSDHVIREIYVAGDNRKPFIAFLLDPTEFPDEVLYFISGFPRISIQELKSEQLRSEIARLIIADDRRPSSQQQEKVLH